MILFLNQIGRQVVRAFSMSPNQKQTVITRNLREAEWLRKLRIIADKIGRQPYVSALPMEQREAVKARRGGVNGKG